MTGASTPQAATAPTRSDSPARKPMIAPKPSMSSDGSRTKPRLAAVTPETAPPFSAPSGSARRGSVTAASRSLSAPEATAPPASTLSRRAASLPCAWISRIVSAVATPAGKRSRSRSSIWLRSPAATTTPSMLTTNTQIASIGQGRIWPVSMASAGIGATSPPEMIEAEDDAAVWFMLFS